MNPARTFPFALALTAGLQAACETPFAVAPEEPAEAKKTRKEKKKKAK